MKKQRRKKTEPKRSNPGRAFALGRHGLNRFESLETRLALSASPITIPMPPIDTPFFPETVETGTPSLTDSEIVEHVNENLSPHDQPVGETAFTDELRDPSDGFISYEANSQDPHIELVTFSGEKPDNLDRLYDAVFDTDTDRFSGQIFAPQVDSPEDQHLFGQVTEEDQFDPALASNFDPALNNRLIDSVMEQSEILHEMTSFSDPNIQFSVPVFSESYWEGFHETGFFNDERVTPVDLIYHGEPDKSESFLNNYEWSDLFFSADQIGWIDDLSIYHEPFISFGENAEFKPLPNSMENIVTDWTDMAGIPPRQEPLKTVDHSLNIPAGYTNQIPLESINLVLRQTAPLALTIESDQVDYPANNAKSAIPFVSTQLSFSSSDQLDDEKQGPIENLPEDQQLNSPTESDSSESTSIEDNDFLTGSSERFSRSNPKGESNELSQESDIEIALQINSDLESIIATENRTMSTTDPDETEEGGFINIVIANQDEIDPACTTAETELPGPETVLKDIAIDAAYDREYAFELAMGEELPADQANVIEASGSLPVSAATYPIPDVNSSEKKNNRPNDETESDNESDNNLSQNDQPYLGEAFSTIIIASAAGQVWQDHQKNRLNRYRPDRSGS